MVRTTDPMINKAARLVVEINDDEAERMRADNRLFFLMDQQGLLREREARGLAAGRAKGLEEGRAKGLEEGRAKGREEGRSKGRKEGRAEGRKEAEAKYRPVIEENQAIKREIEELRRKLREAGIDG